jgi:Uma2 family endonuclease
LAQNNPAIAMSPPSQLSDPTAGLSVEEQLALEGVLFPPTDLYSDEPPLESDLHRDQIDLLLACLRLWWADRNDYYASGNTTIYYNENQLTTRDFRGPDFFVVLGAENRPRKSWVLWAEDGKYPDVIIELLSPSTAAVDRGLKKELYQSRFRTPEYFWFSPATLEFEGFRLDQGRYQPIEPNVEGRRWCESLGLYLGIHQDQLRYFSTEGELVPTPLELAEKAQGEVEQERQQRQAAEAEVERLRAKLRELGLESE